MKIRCLPLVILGIILTVHSTADETASNKRVKRQYPQGAFPQSRRGQFPPPEELEEVEYEEEEEEKSFVRPRFQPGPARSSEEEYVEDYAYTEAPRVTTLAPKTTPKAAIFNNRFSFKPRQGLPPSNPTSAPKPPAPVTPFRATPAQSQRFDVVANILNRSPAPRPASRAINPSANENAVRKPALAPVVTHTNEVPSRRNVTNRVRTRGRPRLRTSTTRSTTTTTTTTTTTEAPVEYYYYYEDSEEEVEQPIATVATTTTTTTTAKPTTRKPFSKRPFFSNRDRSSSSQRSTVKFNIEDQFKPPPDSPVLMEPKTSSATKLYTKSTTEAPRDGGAIPPHLRSKYKPRTDGRFIDFLRDPNRPRELKGFDLTDYPFYVKVPEDIEFDCDDKKDGYYASVPHKCQLFHYCFAGARYDFLCANYTLYDQTTFTCRFANNVDCLSSEKYYNRNDDLWKETTTPAPETTTKRRRLRPPKDDDYYDDDDYDDDYEEEEPERRRRPQKRRRNRRKNRRRPADDE